MSFVIAAVVAVPLSRGLDSFLSAALFQGELRASTDLSGRAICFAACVLLSGAASLIPAWNASRSPVREALEFE
jgi:ABC-type lipoprotein release transport system permease subunit